MPHHSVPHHCVPPLQVVLKPGKENISENLITCYQKLVDINVIGKEEMILLNAWISDLSKL